MPALDWKDIHAIAEGLAGKANDAAYETAVETIFAWLGERTHARQGEGARRLAPLAEVWDKIARSVRETDSYNLDRRALVLTLFSDLSDALRASRAGLSSICAAEAVMAEKPTFYITTAISYPNGTPAYRACL